MSAFIVDDIQQVIDVDGHLEVQEPGSPLLAVKRSHPTHGGQIYHQAFIYATSDDADKEIADRHRRLNEAFTKRNLLLCLSINKEPARKAAGASPETLEKFVEQDQQDYKKWHDELFSQWEEVNGEKPDPLKLARTLRNAKIIEHALENPQAADFTEIMAREAILKVPEKTPTPKER